MAVFGSLLDTEMERGRESRSRVRKNISLYFPFLSLLISSRVRKKIVFFILILSHPQVRAKVSSSTVRRTHSVDTILDRNSSDQEFRLYIMRSRKLGCEEFRYSPKCKLTVPKDIFFVQRTFHWCQWRNHVFLPGGNLVIWVLDPRPTSWSTLKVTWWEKMLAIRIFFLFRLASKM